MHQEYTLEIKSKNGVKDIYFDFANSNRRAAISLLDDVLEAIEAYKRESAFSRGNDRDGSKAPAVPWS